MTAPDLPRSQPVARRHPSLPRFDELLAATAAERDAALDERVVLGAARLDRIRTTALRATFVVATGAHRLTGRAWGDLVVTHAATGASYRVDRMVSWQEDRLVVESVEVDDALLSGAADTANGAHAARHRTDQHGTDQYLADQHRTGSYGTAWYVSAVSSERQWRQRRHEQLGALIEPGQGRFLFTGRLDARQTRLLSGDPALLRCALAAAALELLIDERRVLVVSADPVALDEVALVIEQLHDADVDLASMAEPFGPGQPAGQRPAAADPIVRLGAGTVVRIGTPALESVAADPRLTLDAALGHHAGEHLAELGALAAELRQLLDLPTGANATVGGSPGVIDPEMRARPEMGARAKVDAAPAGDAGPAGDADPRPPVGPAATVSSPEADGPGTGPRAGPATVPQPTPGASDRPSAAQLAAARAELSEAGALRAAAEADARLAAEAHGAAREDVRRLDGGRDGHRRVEELARRLELATAESAASAAGVGRLVDAVRRADPEEQLKLVRQLLIAAEVATNRLERRDEIIEDLDTDRARVQTSGIARRDIDRAEQALRRARADHAEAEAVVQRARQAEAAARERVADLAGARLRDVSIVPGGPAASGEPVAPVSALDREEAVHRLRARYVDANARRRQASGLAIDRARVVLVTPQDLVMVDELQGQRFDHLLVEQACLLDAASLCLASAHIERSVVLAVDLDQHPPPPIADEPAPRWWLGASLLQLLGLADPVALAAHPASLAIG